MENHSCRGAVAFILDNAIELNQPSQFRSTNPFTNLMSTLSKRARAKITREQIKTADAITVRSILAFLDTIQQHDLQPQFKAAWTRANPNREGMPENFTEHDINDPKLAALARSFSGIVHRKGNDSLPA